ncbi:basic proline-rich protein-like [Monodon monoceros]|uniref:basic proline-rich protein-like n=1 Tax=Monodon monoceros TaxID=40151 RepID=UPI0010F98B05|nr:basic proline-rich protein-like [Monodon monoceros]
MSPESPSRPEPTQRLQSRALPSRSPGDPLTRPVSPEKTGGRAKLPPPSGQSRNPNKDAGLRCKPFRPQQPTKAVPAPAGRRYIALSPGDPDKQTEPQYTASLSQECETRRPLSLKGPPKPHGSEPKDPDKSPSTPKTRDPICCQPPPPQAGKKPGPPLNRLLTPRSPGTRYTALGRPHPDPTPLPPRPPHSRTPPSLAPTRQRRAARGAAPVGSPPAPAAPCPRSPTAPQRRRAPGFLTWVASEGKRTGEPSGREGGGREGAAQACVCRSSNPSARKRLCEESPPAPRAAGRRSHSRAHRSSREIAATARGGAPARGGSRESSDNPESLSAAGQEAGLGA